MAGPTIVRLAVLDIDPAQRDAYLALLTEEIDASLACEPGVLMLNAVASRAEPHRITLMEVYASQQAYQAHLQTPHFLKYKTATASMVTRLDLIEQDPIRLALPTKAS